LGASFRFLQCVHLDCLLLNEHLLALCALPAGHLGQSVLVLLAANVKLGILREIRSFGRRYRVVTKTGVHWRLRFVSMVWWDIRLIEVLAPAASGRVAAAAAVAAALKTVEERTATGQSATGTTDDAPNHREDDQATNDDKRNDRPPRNEG
jgi:hypothetical protein